MIVLMSVSVAFFIFISETNPEGYLIELALDLSLIYCYILSIANFINGNSYLN